MGRNQARILSSLSEYELVGVCDVVPEAAVTLAGEYGVRAFTGYEEALAELKPDTVSVCTQNSAHAAPAIVAAEAGVRGVYCEKPMAVKMAEAWRMVEACEESGTELVVNHQRRLGADLVMARDLILQGAIGEVQLMRGNCAGDILSDGTHAVDSLLWMAGDPEVQWVFGQVHRDTSEGLMIERARAQSAKSGRKVEVGFRYGHPVENGGMGVFMLANDIRCEVACGDMRDGYRPYQDYEIIGTQGRLWRTGDRTPNLYIQDSNGGPLVAGVDDTWVYRPLAAPDGAKGVWREVELPPYPYASPMEEGYVRFARMVRTGDPHPMCGRNALRSFEVIMAIYESARTHRKLRMPLSQGEFPLGLMVQGERRKGLKSRADSEKRAVMTEGVR